MIGMLRSLIEARFPTAPSLNGAVVLTYHGALERIGDARLERNYIAIADLRRQVALLRRLRVISLPELAGALAEGAAPASITITVDDGLAAALPLAEVLSDARLPWALFVSTGPVARGGTIWTTELALLLLHGRADFLESETERFPLDTRPAREGVFQSMRTAMKLMPAAERERAMQRVRAAFPPAETERLLAMYPRLRSLSWDQLRALHAEGVTIGSHGVEHEIHHAHQSADMRTRELVDSRVAIEREIGARCEYFSYPNGDSVPSSEREVRQAGYAFAFGARPGVIERTSPPTALPRVEAGGNGSALVRNLRRAMSAGAPS